MSGNKRVTGTVDDWAEYWNGDTDGVPSIPPANEEAITSFAHDGDGGCRMTAPDGTVYKEYYGNGWQAGLTTMTKSYASIADANSDSEQAPTWKKKTTTNWTQDNTNLSYQTNPRVIETNVYDSSGNRRRTTIDYGQPNQGYVQWSLPYLVREYDANGNVIRNTYTDYNLDSQYLARRIIGLVKWVHMSDSAWQSKTTYEYDTTSIDPQATNATQHDGSSYSTSFNGRGNVTSISRWDVTDGNTINDSSKALTTQVSYDAAGSVLSTIDPAMHTSSISYDDSFSDGNNSRNTFAYPTTVTDADGYQSTVQYNFDTGAMTRQQTPLPNVTYNSPGPVQTFEYDSAGRLQWIHNLANGAWRFIAYASSGDAVMSQVTINAETNSYWTITVVDGADRTRLTGGDHPGSNGGYAGQFTSYDVMGRPVQQSNPTETNASWQPTGDDLFNPATGEGGWRYTTQTYDWKGRPLRTTNQDGTYKEASYTGCGCAGGEVVTLTDEVGRQQKIYSDVLGRQWKTEIMNGASVYSTSVNVFNARDQVVRVKQYAGAAPTDASSTNAAASCPTGTCQETLLTYDPYGRLKTKHMPEQQVDPNNSASTDHTTYNYNADDTVHSVTDARGSYATYSYNNRHLVTGIVYTPSSGVAATPSVGYEYDAAGNRTSMTDGLGSKSYTYDSLSRMMSETRTITNVGTFALNYDYNLAGELKKITDATGMTINYAYDAVRRLNGVTGSDNLYAGVSNYASNFQYRAWGGLKAMTDGTSHISSLAYNSKLQPSQFDISSNIVHQNYDYYNDGRISFVHNTTDAKFDRSYTYDHKGRTVYAFSGGAARGDTGDVPYFETFGYDAFSNTTARFTETWVEDDFSDAASYSNNRRNGWGYDADGRIKTINNRQYSYDAAGNQTALNGQIWTGSSYVSTTISNGADGDGNKVQEVSTYPSTVTTYYLRSTVLRGAIVEELSGAGQKQIGYVYYPSGELLARQSGSVVWKHSTAANSGEYEIYGNGFVHRIELDPMRGDVGLTAPLPPDTHGDPGDIGSNHNGGSMDSRFGDMGNPAGGCVNLNGNAFPCGLFDRGTLSVLDLSQKQPQSSTSTTTANLWVADYSHSHGTVDLEKFVVTVYADDGPLIEEGVVSLSLALTLRPLLPQNPTPVPFPGTDAIRNRLNSKDCNDYIAKLLAKAGELYGGSGNIPVAKDGLDLLNKISSQGGFVLQNPVRVNGYPVAGTVTGSIAGNNTYAAGTATVLISTRFGSAARFGYWQADYLDTAIHEMLHLAGRYSGYDDTQLAVAASKLPGANPALPGAPKGPNDMTGIGANSGYYDRELKKHCGGN